MQCGSVRAYSKNTLKINSKRLRLLLPVVRICQSASWSQMWRVDFRLAALVSGVYVSSGGDFPPFRSAPFVLSLVPLLGDAPSL